MTESHRNPGHATMIKYRIGDTTDPVAIKFYDQEREMCHYSSACH